MGPKPCVMYLFPSRYTRGVDLLGAAMLYAVATILIIRMLQERRPVPTREHILSAAVS